MFQSAQAVKVKQGHAHEGRAGHVVSDDGEAVGVMLDANPDQAQELVTFDRDELQALDGSAPIPAAPAH